jgi:hypothetical protein
VFHLDASTVHGDKVTIVLSTDYMHSHQFLWFVAGGLSRTDCGVLEEDLCRFFNALEGKTSRRMLLNMIVVRTSYERNCWLGIKDICERKWTFKSKSCNFSHQQMGTQGERDGPITQKNKKHWYFNMAQNSYSIPKLVIKWMGSLSFGFGFIFFVDHCDECYAIKNLVVSWKYLKF